MADPKILYNNLFSDKLYTKSYDDFVKQFEEEEAAQKLYNNLRQDGLYTQDFDSFKTQFKLGKQNGPVQENTAIAGSVNTSSTDLNLEDTSSELPKDPNREKLIQLETELDATRADPKTMNSTENLKKRRN